ncbi:MAG: hypothetical protein JO003_05945 [Candidatus Eremiobacteraeota bacterium]|nr:hypothetical protein [Candidatus Eremiobacteraeota bacterium]
MRVFRFTTAAALSAAMLLGSLTPALADGSASTRNIFLAAAAAAIGITNWNHKRRIKDQEMHEQSRRQSAYREWYYKKYGHYPTDQEFRDWYAKTYGVQPS